MKRLLGPVLGLVIAATAAAPVFASSAQSTRNPPVTAEACKAQPDLAACERFNDKG